MFLNIRKLYKVQYYSSVSQGRFVFKKGWKVGKNFAIQFDLSTTFLLIEEGFQCRDDFKILLGNNGRLNIGANCFFNNRCSITCLGNIQIGNDNQFGENVLFYDHNHHYSDIDKLISEQGYKIGSIKIGCNCWIGSNVVILKDVEIGDNVVIGAGCVIYKSIESGSVVVNEQNLVVKGRNKI